MRAPQSSHVHRIGIVDDDDAVRDAIHTLLETYGFLVSEYRSAEEYLRQPQDDCVLLIDLTMDGLDGLDLAELLRKGGIRTPIILMKDITRSWQARRIFSMDGCSPLNKPVDSASLLTAINASLAAAACAVSTT